MDVSAEMMSRGFETRSIQVGQDFEQWGHLEMVPPIVNAMTFYQKDPVNIDVCSHNFSNLLRLRF